MKTKCQINEAPFFQCCCQCKSHLKTYYRCTTNPKPSKYLLKENQKFYFIPKGWACVIDERIYDKWPEHSRGCELFNKKETT